MMTGYVPLRRFIYLHLMLLIVLADGATKYWKHAVTSSARTDVLLLMLVAVAIWATFALTPAARGRDEGQENVYASPAARLGMLGLVGVLFGLSAVIR